MSDHDDNDVQRSLGRIEGLMEGFGTKLQEHAQALKEHATADSERFAAIDTKLDAVAGQVSKIVGSRSLAVRWGAIAGTVVTAFIAACAKVASAYLHQ